MVDPWTGFAAAGNVLQITELGIKVIKKIIEYSRYGGSNEHQELQDVVQRLMAMSTQLETSTLQSRRGLPPGPERVLQNATAECLRVSQSLFAVLENLKLKQYASRWYAIKLALSTFSKKQVLENLTKQMEHARANLTLSLMFYMEHKVTENQDEVRNSHVKIMQGVLHNAQDSSTIMFEIAKLTEKMDNASLARGPDVWMQWEGVLKAHSKTLHDVSTRLENLTGDEALMKRQNTNLLNTHLSFEQLSKDIDRDLLNRRRILNSLYYSQMNNRRDRVPRAHNQTYQWILEAKPVTQNDSRMWTSYVRWLCESEDQPIFWIHGKPGSGKTTILRELDQRISQELRRSGVVADDWSDSMHLDDAVEGSDSFSRRLNGWIGSEHLLKASCYLWNAGSSMQKSLTGLLQSLAHQLLEQRPDLTDKVVSRRRWQAASYGDTHLEPWEKFELIALLEQILHHSSTQAKVLLFIDGLDELDGSDEQREEMLEVLQRLTELKRVKACVASRPWNIFRDALEKCPKIRLEDWTKNDIQCFVRERLNESKWFQKQLRSRPDALTDICNLIVTKAQGVFLWVILVVKDLLKILRDGGKLSDLTHKVEQTPPDLDDYFKKIMETVDVSYRREAAVILTTALHEMHWNHGTVPGPDFCLFHLDYVAEERNPRFITEFSVDDLEDTMENDYITNTIEMLERRLNSRCMGLLEASTQDWHQILYSADDVWTSKLEFLHRTARDFLLRPAAQSILREFLDGDFDASVFWYNLMVVNAAALGSLAARNLCPGDLAWNSVCCFFQHLVTCSDPDENAFALFEKMTTVLSRRAMDRDCRMPVPSPLYGKTGFILAESKKNFLQEMESAMSLAVKLCWKPYIDRRLTPDLVRRKDGRPLLDVALLSALDQDETPDLSTVRKILDLGGDPNSCTGADGSDTIWARFFARIAFAKDCWHKEFHEVIRILVNSGITSNSTIPAKLLELDHRVTNEKLIQEFCLSVKGNARSGFTPIEWLLYLHGVKRDSRVELAKPDTHADSMDYSANGRTNGHADDRVHDPMLEFSIAEIVELEVNYLKHNRAATRTKLSGLTLADIARSQLAEKRRDKVTSPLDKPEGVPDPICLEGLKKRKREDSWT